MKILIFHIFFQHEYLTCYSTYLLNNLYVYSLDVYGEKGNATLGLLFMSKHSPPLLLGLLIIRNVSHESSLIWEKDYFCWKIPNDSKLKFSIPTIKY